MTGLLDVDAERFSASFGHAPFAIRHALTGDPLLDLAALADLADTLPARQVEHNLGDLPTVLPDGGARRIDASPGEIVRGIETNRCWTVLKNVESDPAYRALLDAALDEVAPAVAAREGPMILREAFVFVSASGSVTPVHIDPEHNFLLQIRGRKQINVASIVGQQELERYYSGGHRNIDRLPDDSVEFRLDPGDGVYVPVHATHWVTNGPAVSISLSITFRTPATRHVSLVHEINARLRRLRLRPAPPGTHPLGDGLKAQVARAGHLFRRVLG